MARAATDSPCLPGEIELLLVEPPNIEKNYSTLGEDRERQFTAQRVNFLNLEARNASLGLLGEELVVDFERNRLLGAGLDSFADRIEHVSKDQGDGAGFDIRSFDLRGRDFFIEVKTTRFSKYTPFYITDNEVEFSKGASNHYSIYRLFSFCNRPRLFTLPGDVSKNCNLSPTVYRAGF